MIGIDRRVARRPLTLSEVMSFLSCVPTIVPMEACATAISGRARLGALGHEVRLIAPQYTRAYVKANKNDAADAEVALRPTMQFVAAKSPDQQTMQNLAPAQEVGPTLGISARRELASFDRNKFEQITWN